MMDKGMGFDPNKYIAEQRAENIREDARARAEGTRQRARCVDVLLEVMTAENTPFDGNQMRELRSVMFYLCPESKELIDKVCSRHSEPKEREVLRGILLSIIAECANRLID